MNISTIGNTNSYETNAVNVLKGFASFLEASANVVVLAISFSPLDNPSRDALEKSCGALGFGNDRIGFVTLLDAQGKTLEPEDLWTVIEGLDGYRR